MELGPWFCVSALGALALGLGAWSVERVLPPVWFPLARGLWFAALIRLLLPAEVGSPVGASWTGRAIDPSSVEGSGGTSLAILWIVGAALLIAGMVLRMWAERRRWSTWHRGPVRSRTRSLAERCATSIGLRRVPHLVATDGPASCGGILRPVIAIPRALEGSSNAHDLEVVLLHELTHVRRRDGLRRLLLDLVVCAVWFHPVPWLARRSFARHAELECDRAALRWARGGRDACRRALLDAASAWIDRTPLSAAGASAFRPAKSALVMRLRAIDRAPRFGRMPTLTRRAGVACTAVLALALLGPVARGPVYPTVPEPGSAEFDELDGCLLAHYAVLSAIANGAPPPSSPQDR